MRRVHAQLHFVRDKRKRKLEYAGHVLRGSSGESHLYLLEGKISEKRARGRPRRTWMNDIIDWTGIHTSGEIKRVAEDRNRWKTIVVNLLLEDDK